MGPQLRPGSATHSTAAIRPLRPWPGWLLAALVAGGCSSLPPPIRPADHERSAATADALHIDVAPARHRLSTLPHDLAAHAPATHEVDLQAEFVAGLPTLDCTRYPAARARPYTAQILGKVLTERRRMFDFVLRSLRAERLSSIYALIPLLESQLQADPGNRGDVRGLWQFSTDTARLYALLDVPGLDRRLDAVAATTAAIQHLQMLEQKFSDWRLVLAAYNAGPYRVSRAVNDRRARQLPVEPADLRLPGHTLGYIDRLGALACLLANHPELQQPLRLSLQSRLQRQSLKACSTGEDGGPISASDAVAVNRVRQWNPLLRAAGNLPADFSLLLPANQACSKNLLARLRPAPTQPPATGERPTLYRVQSGDSLWLVARRYSLSVEQLLQWNRLQPDAVLRIGQVLRLAP